MKREHILEVLEQSLQKEDGRLMRLASARDHNEKRRLETKFKIERERERKLVELVKEDHEAQLRKRKPHCQVLSKSNDAHVKIHNTAPLPEEKGTRRRDSSTRQYSMSTKLHLMKKQSASNHKSTGNPVQEAAFHQYMVTKFKTAPRPKSKPGLLTHENVQAHTAVSEKNLLLKKCTLLKQLHTILEKQQRILEDDQVTVRSSVSSYKTLPRGNQHEDYRYVPFESVR